MNFKEWWDKDGHRFGPESVAALMAWNAAIEEAAKACDDASDLHANGEDFMDGCSFCAAEVRELKQSEPQTGRE